MNPDLWNKLEIKVGKIFLPGNLAALLSREPK